VSQPRFTVERLAWADEALGTISMPARPMALKASFGSGLTRREQDPEGIVWAVGDRGPNLKIKTMVEHYGAESLKPLGGKSGAKVMPRLDIGPRIAQLRVHEERVELVSSIRLGDPAGEAISGLPVPGGPHALSEPAMDLEGNVIPPDPSGLDTEGIAELPEGGFLVGDEFGPSLVRLDAEGRVLARIVPRNVTLEGARYPVQPLLPAIASKRQLNRGFEAIALSGDGKWLFLAFQSPLAHPDEAAHARARHVRLWRIDAATFEVVSQYLYPLDAPASFVRDGKKGELDWSDLKVSELTWVGGDRLLVLERASETTKIYQVTLTDQPALDKRHLDTETRPTLEELSGQGENLPALIKALIFSSDDAPEVAADLEGMAILSPTELLLVNDNDFGVEGAETSFWRITFEEPVLR
jgi:hypothetical protein